MHILFCGEAFPASRAALRRALDAVSVDGEIHEWPDGRISTLPDAVDVIIPLMRRIDALVMDARPFRLIHQWGAGLEGVDLEAARERRIWVANVPTAGGNADSGRRGHAARGGGRGTVLRPDCKSRRREHRAPPPR